MRATPIAQFGRSLFSIIGLNALIKPAFILLVDFRIQQIWGSSLYGQYYSLLQAILLSNVLLDLGFTGWYTTKAAANTHEAEHYFAAFLPIKMSLNLVYTISAWLITIGMGWQFSWLAIGLVLLQVINSWLLLARARLTVFQRFQADAWMSVADKGLLLLILLPWLHFYPQRLLPTYYVAIQLFTSLLITCIAFLLVPSRTNVEHQPKNSSLSQTWRQAIPFALIWLTMTLWSKYDILLIKHWFPFHADVGKYASILRLFELTNMGGFIIAAWLLPYLSFQNRYANETGAVTYQLSIRWLAAMGIGLTIFAQYSFSWWQPFLLPQADNQWQFWLKLACWSIVPQYLLHGVTTYLTASLRWKQLVMINLCCLALGFAVNWFGLPKLGIALSIWTFFIGNSVYALLCLYKTPFTKVELSFMTMSIAWAIAGGLMQVFFPLGLDYWLITGMALFFLLSWFSFLHAKHLQRIDTTFVP